MARQETCLPLSISQWSMKCNIPWIAHMSDLCGLHTGLRRGFWDWMAHGQRQMADRAEWIAWLLCHSLHFSTQSPHFSAGSTVQVAIPVSFHRQWFFITEDAVQAWNMLAKRRLLHLADFPFLAISRHSECTNCLPASGLSECRVSGARFRSTRAGIPLDILL